ncbi:MAG: hypothetical protein NW206_09740 [Hyphomonadaceae bacterium]|nr:hypothetical protein [Hyphomonadaceae bacterium]
MPVSENRVAIRLRWYWQMEAANAVLLPVLAWLLVAQSGGTMTAAFGASALACAWLLVIGALYWRAVLRKMQGASGALDYWLPRLAKAEFPSLALVLVAASAIALEFAMLGGGWTAARIAAVALATLAALEYVNYYKIQLQHFDNGADFKRLITGRGFRKAHMARDIAAWRAAKREN